MRYIEEHMAWGLSTAAPETRVRRRLEFNSEEGKGRRGRHKAPLSTVPEA